MNAVSKFTVEALKVVQMALLAVALLLLVLPQARAVEMRSLLTALLTIECAWLMYRVWRRGMLSMTPEESVGRVMDRGPMTSGWLERSSLLAGFAAVLVLAF